MAGADLFGGRRAYGGGGYHRSALEDILPITCELRDEHRKLSVAMSLVLDRSGSMGAGVAGGGTKMDLANRGAAAVIELLGPRDAVSVYAVDSAPHEVLELQAVTDAATLQSQVRRIESQGGGIYVEAG